MFRNNLHRISSNVAWLVVNRVVTKIAGLVALGFVARYLGTTQFGTLSYALVLTGMFNAVSSMGLDGILIRELVRSPENNSIVLGTGFVLRLAGALAAFTLVALAALLDPTTQPLLPLFVVVAASFFPQTLEVADLWFQKNIQSKFPVMGRTAAVLIGAGIKCALVYHGAPLIWFAWACLAEAILNSVAVMLVYRLRKQSFASWSFSAPLARAMLRDCWPLIVSGLLVAFYMRLEQLLVRTFFGDSSLGVYIAAAQITEAWSFLPAFILSSIYPLLVEERKSSPHRFEERLQTVFDALTGAGYLVALAVSCLAPFLIPILFGDRYVRAIPVLVIQSLAAPIFFSGAVRAQYFLLENLNIYHTLTASLGIAVNISLSLALMPSLGIVGASVAGFGGALVAGFLTSWAFKPLRRCAFWQLKAFLVPFRVGSLFNALRARHDN